MKVYTAFLDLFAAYDSVSRDREALETVAKN